MRKRFVICYLLIAAATIGYAQTVKVVNPDTVPVPVKNVQSGPGTADKILSLTTGTSGSNWTAFASQACRYVLIVNDTGTKLSARIGGAGNTMSIPDGSWLKLGVALNSNEVAIRRADTANSQVTISARAIEPKRLTLSVSGAGDPNADGSYPDLGNVDPSAGFPIYQKLNGYSIKYAGFRSDPAQAGLATFQWGLFDAHDIPLYFGDQNQTGGGDPTAVSWNAATPENIPPFAVPPAPRVEFL
jgi:hypothetical protein